MVSSKGRNTRSNAMSLRKIPAPNETTVGGASTDSEKSVAVSDAELATAESSHEPQLMQNDDHPEATVDEEQEQIQNTKPGDDQNPLETQLESATSNEVEQNETKEEENVATSSIESAAVSASVAVKGEKSKKRKRHQGSKSKKRKSDKSVTSASSESVKAPKKSKKSDDEKEDEARNGNANVVEVTEVTEEAEPVKTSPETFDQDVSVASIDSPPRKEEKSKSPPKSSRYDKDDRRRRRSRERERSPRREPEKPKIPEFKILHAGTGSWQHLKYTKPNQGADTTEQQNGSNETSKANEYVQEISSYPPKRDENQPNNDYFLSQHAAYNEDNDESIEEERTITVQCQPVVANQSVTTNQVITPGAVDQHVITNQVINGNEFKPPLPPPPEDEEQLLSENFDLLLGFGLSEDAAKHVDLLFTCNYLTEPLPDELILELAELEEETVIALAESFRNTDLSKIKNRLVFFKARLKLVKMKGVNALPNRGSSTANSNNRSNDPQSVESHQGGFIQNTVPGRVNKPGGQVSSVSQSDVQKIMSQANALQNKSNVNMAQSQTYTYMAMHKLANGGSASQGQSGSNKVAPQTTTSGTQGQNTHNPSSEISGAPVMNNNSQQNCTENQQPSQQQNQYQNNQSSHQAYNYPPNPYQDMSSVAQQGAQQNSQQYPSANSYNGAYPGYNYYGAYNANYGWGSSASPATASGGDSNAKPGNYAGLGYNSNAPAFSGPGYRTGPDMSKMNEILLRTGYNYEHNHVIRKYGPPPDWVGDPPTSGHELFVGKIPTDCWEDEIIPIFEQIGKIYEVKILIDKETNLNKGFCFVCMCTKEDAKQAISRLSGSYVRQRCRIFVKYSVQFTRLFVGGIPRNKSREEIFSAFHDEVHNLSDVEVLGGDDGMQNRGFAFLDFKTYFDAAVARKRLQAGRVSIRAWGRYSKFVVEWAVPLDNPDEEAKEQSRTILVKNLAPHTTEGEMYATFQGYGAINKVFKQQHYAFVEFMERESCLVAIEGEKKRGGYECRIHTPIPEVSKRMVQIIRERTAEKDAMANMGGGGVTGNGYGGGSGSSSGYGGMGGYGSRAGSGGFSNRLTGANNQPLGAGMNQNSSNSNSGGGGNSSYDAYTRGYYDAQYRAHYDAYMNQASGGAPPSNYNYPPLTGYGSTATPTPANLPPSGTGQPSTVMERPKTHTLDPLYEAVEPKTMSQR
ncbi:uncharacterized protein LOC142337847 isoform X3 [Convolutriloba macropyga]|uniref:uncharacterized protein LOC142337847 isoform X3 n=1 Tax=Convolutriloba macropyga TaxID=536237 RepID=UPI003F51C6E4